MSLVGIGYWVGVCYRSFRGNLIKMKRVDLDKYIEKHTNFKVYCKVYNDGHLHLNYNSGVCLK